MKADPARKARIEAHLAELDRLLREHPELKQRTAAFLGGELEGVPMPKKGENLETITLRLPRATVERVEAMAQLLSQTQDANPWMASWGGRVTPSVVIRLALVRGLEVLEAEGGMKPGKPAKGRKARP